MNIYPAYISKHNLNYEKQILLMIPNGEGQHYLSVKQLSALLKGVTSKHKDKLLYILNLIKRYVKIKIFDVL